MVKEDLEKSRRYTLNILHNENLLGYGGDPAAASRDRGLS